MVEDGGTLELGVRTLKFYLTPMVHWLETMMTYEPKDQILIGSNFDKSGLVNMLPGIGYFVKN